MLPIRMVDTKNQYLKIKSEIDDAIQQVLDSSAFINGKQVRDFASDLCAFLDVKHTNPCANGTDALQIAMMALDLQPGDEVITPSFTFIATIESIALLRLMPVFAEVDPKTFCIDPASVEKLITNKTKAIVPVHLYGQAAPMEEIMAIARKHDLFVIEDNAQAIGCDYFFADGTKKKTGTIGTIGTTSFYPSKNLGAFGDGGAIFTNDDQLSAKIKMIANHGESRRYYHDVVGFNSRLDTLQAAILIIKLKRLDEYIAARQKVADYYDKAFENNPRITQPYRAPYCNHVFHQYTLLLDGTEDPEGYRNALNKYLAQHHIPSMIYYPVPAHRQKMLHPINKTSIHLPITDWLAARVISLPMHTEMGDDQLQYITSKVLEYINN